MLNCYALLPYWNFIHMKGIQNWRVKLVVLTMNRATSRKNPFHFAWSLCQLQEKQIDNFEQFCLSSYYLPQMPCHSYCLFRKCVAVFLFLINTDGVSVLCRCLYGVQLYVTNNHELECKWIYERSIYLNDRERYEDIDDYRSYIHNLSSCDIKPWKKFRSERDSNPLPLRYRCNMCLVNRKIGRLLTALEYNSHKE